MKNAVRICAALSALIVLLTFASCGKTQKRYSVTYADTFDTVTEFSAYCDSEAQFDRACEALHGELLRLHRIFDIYNEYEGVNNAATVNRLAGSQPVDVPDELIALLDICRTFYESSGGKLDASLGSVLSIWHDCRESADRLPDMESLKEAAKHTGFQFVKTEGSEISFTDPGLSLDLGAVAKGYAAGRAAEAVKRSGVISFALDVGGNVVTGGAKPDGNWLIGVTDPEGGLYTNLAVSGLAVVTSGDYQRFYELDGVRYHHIIDPDTLYPAGLYRSVTVICGSSAYADALSTALFCMSVQDGKALAQSYDAEALWIKADGSAERTAGFASYER